MTLKKIFLVFISFYLSTIAFSQQNTKAVFIKGYTDNNLEVLDWGGKGKPILFITGLGNSAHIYEDFASKFIKHYRVYGMTRRGFGKSDRTKNGFSTDTLVKDILKVIDNLGLQKVTLIGHSIAGDEISTFARKYPDRVSATIFLDAAYNHSNLSELGKFPQTPNPPDTLVLNIQNIVTLQKKEMGFSFPLPEQYSLSYIDSSGKVFDDTTSYFSFSSILNFAKPISYLGIKCPSLAIYAQRETVKERFPAYNLFDSTNKELGNEVMPRWNKYYKTEVENYKRDCNNCLVKEIKGGHHYIFLSNPKETEIAIKNFLKQL